MDNKMSDDFLADDEMSLKDLVAKLSKWWKFLVSKIFIIVIIGLLGGTLSAIVAYFDKTMYTAELTFVLEGSKASGSQLGGYAGLASQLGVDMGGGGGQGVFEGENFLALMKSRLMTEKALLTTVNVKGKKITLAEFYVNMNPWRQKWEKEGSDLANVRFLPGSDPKTFSRQQNTIINISHKSILNKNLVVEKQDKKSGIISLRVSSEDELFSKYFAEILAKEVSAFYIETKTKKSVDNVSILQHQTDSIKRALNYALVGAASSIDANPNPNMAREVLRVPSQRRQGDVQVNQAILSQLVTNLEIAKMSLLTETPLIQIIDRPVLPLTKTAPNLLIAFIKWSIVTTILASIFLILRNILNNL
jgi:hypothetical protein